MKSEMKAVVLRAAVAVFSLGISSANASPSNATAIVTSNTPIAASGGMPADTYHPIENSRPPRLRDGSMVAFGSNLLNYPGTSPEAVAIATPGNAPVTIVRSGQLLSGTTTKYLTFGDVDYNDTGTVAIQVSTQTSSNQFLYSIDSYHNGLGLSVVAQQGQAAPLGLGNYSYFFYPSINNAGEIAFLANTNSSKGILRSDSLGITPLVAGGMSTNSIYGPVRVFYAPTDGYFKLNTSGQVVAGAYVGTSFATQKIAIVRSTSAQSSSGGNLDVMAVAGDVPLGYKTISAFQSANYGSGRFDINNAGDTAFAATFTDGTTGLYSTNGPRIYVPIAYQGDKVPDPNSASGFNGTFSKFEDQAAGLFTSPEINNKGIVVFSALNIAGTTGGTNDNSGIFIFNGSKITQVARKGEVIPQVGTVQFNSYLPKGELNDLGHVAYSSNVLDASNNSVNSIMLWSPLRTVPLVQIGDTYDGATIISLTQAPSVPLNNHDQVSFGATLSDGRTGYFVSDASRAVGLSQFNPVIPTPQGAALQLFVCNGTPTNSWVDPSSADAYTYTMTGGSLFTEIADFPTGFNTPFQVFVDGNLVGTYGPGQSLDFTAFPGGGVTSFTVSGLDPLVDPSNPQAFPLALAFSTATADFSIEPINVPEPDSGTILLFSGFTFASRRQRKTKLVNLQ